MKASTFVHHKENFQFHYTKTKLSTEEINIQTVKMINFECQTVAHLIVLRVEIKQ